MSRAPGQPHRVLFICSRNQWRSPTAEQVWRRHPDIQCRSAGTSTRARRTVTAGDVQWADVIYVMETKHRNRIQAHFGRLVTYTPIVVLNIPDDYDYMDADLVAIFESELDAFLAT
ncbi:MAG: phosphotyrosine protein phosphatase [Rhodothermales bacterium]